MKRAFLALFLAVLVGVGPAGAAHAGPDPGTPFSDTSGHWAAAQVDRAAGLHLVAGYPDGSFRPNGLVTRAEFIKMAVQVRGLTPRPGSGGFADVDRHWVAAQGYLQAAVDGGLVVPVDFAAPDGATLIYEPDRPITRQEMVVIAVRVMGKQSEAMALRGAPLLFTDVPAWASGFVSVATSAGIIRGYTDGSFGGSRNLTRAEAAVIALRLLETIVAEGTLPPPAGLEPQTPRTVPVWEAASWNVSTLPIPPDTADTPSDAMAVAAAPDGTLYYNGDGQIFRIGADGGATLVATVPVNPTPNGVAADSAGNLYYNTMHQVMRITPDGKTAPWAGSGQNGYASGDGTAAGFEVISGMCSDPLGNIYVTEGGRVRKIDSEARVTTLAGLTPLQAGALWSPYNSTGGAPQEGPGYLADLGQHLSICAADRAGNVYIADTTVIRRIAPDGTISWFAGNPYGGYADGLAAEAQFRNVTAMAADDWGNLWVADSGNQRIRRVTPDGRVYTVAGGGFDGTPPHGYNWVPQYGGSHVDGPGPDARFNQPAALAVAGGRLYVAEKGDVFGPPGAAPGSTPRHLRVIAGSAAAYPADKVAVPLTGAGMVPAAVTPGKAPQGPITVAYALYSPVEALRFQVDGTAVGSGSEQPYTAGWDASAAAPGIHDLQVSVRLPDIGWLDGGHSPVNVLSAPPPDSFPVHYTLVTPAYHSWIKGTVTLTAAGDGGPLELRMDGRTLARGNGRLLSIAWDSTMVADGEHKLELGHLTPGQADLAYDEIPLHVINRSAPPPEDDLGSGLRVFLGGNRITYKHTAPRVVDDVAYVPFWETMDRAGALVSRDGVVLTARKGDRVTTLNVDTGEATVTAPNLPDWTFVLEHKPVQEGDVLFVPWDFVANVLGMNGAWAPQWQAVHWW